MQPKTNDQQFQSTTDKSLREQIPLLQKFRLIRDTRGHSRALCYVIENNTDRYFMKIYPGNRTAKIRNIESIYSHLAIPTAQIIDQFYVASINATVCLYEYISGPTVKDAAINMNVTDLEHLGHRVGAELAKFSQIQDSPSTFRNNFESELSDLICNTHLQYHKCVQENISLEYIDLDRLERSLYRLKYSIYAVAPTFIHDDITFNNIILHGNTPYFIDTDGGKIKSRALDFRGNCWWGWDDQPADKEKAFYRGIYMGLFADHIPEDFHRELSFALIYEFFLRNQRYADNLEQIAYAFHRWHEIIEQAKYFEDYRFSWF